MKYLGGKARLASEIVPIIESFRPTKDSAYFEPFLGGCNILPLIKGVRHGSDVHPDLIMLYQEMQNGWRPPQKITEDDYQKLRKSEPSALRGFVGFSCSFGGKWFGGYARSGDRNYAKEGYNSLIKAFAKIDNDCHFTCTDYLDLQIPDKSLIYCDPPYKGFTKFKSGAFNDTVFWDWVRKISEHSTVLVSGYQAPEDFRKVWERERNLELQTTKTNKKRVERLYRWSGS